MSFVTHMACRGFATSAQRLTHIKQITVIGGGQMGAGIAQVRSNFDKLNHVFIMFLYVHVRCSDVIQLLIVNCVHDA